MGRDSDMWEITRAVSKKRNNHCYFSNVYSRTLLLERNHKSGKVNIRMNFFYELWSYWVSECHSAAELIYVFTAWILECIQWVCTDYMYNRIVLFIGQLFSVSTVDSALSRHWVTKRCSITMDIELLRLLAMTVGISINRYMLPIHSICYTIPDLWCFKRSCRRSAGGFGHSCTSGSFDYTTVVASYSQ